MADPVDIVETLAKMFVARETSFATGGTDVVAHPVAESLEHSRNQVSVDVKTLRVRPFDARNPVKSYKNGACKFSYLLQPAATVLNAAATVPTGAAEPPLWVLADCVLGGMSVFAGSELVAGATVGGGSVTATQGSRLPAGQLCLVEDPTDGLVAARITSRATDAITWYPELANAPATGADIINAVTFYVSRTNSKSLRVRVANAQDANYQFEYTGGTGTMELKLARGELAAADFDLMFALYNGPAPLGLSRAHVADSMETPLICRNAQVYLQSVATTTRVQYTVEAMSLKIGASNKHVETLSGGTEGMRAVMRSEGLNDPGVTLELTMRADRDLDTLFNDATALTCMLVIPVDTATGRRAIIIDMPRAIIKDVPKFAKGANNLVKCTVMLEGHLDQSCTGTLDNEELATTCLRIGIA